MSSYLKSSITTLGLLILLIAPRLSAQPATPPTDAAIDSGPGLRVPFIVWSAAVASDQITTYQFSSAYRNTLHEENPIIRPLDRHPALLVTAGAAIDATTGWLAYRLLGTRHPKLLRAALYGAAAYRGYLAMYNIRMMRFVDTLRSPAPVAPPS